MIIMLCTSPAIPSAFSCPYLCSSSAGFTDWDIEKKFIIEAERSRKESTAEVMILREFVIMPKTIFRIKRIKLTDIDSNAALFFILSFFNR